MELNIMSTDMVYPNINIIFDDSIYAVDDDTAFICSVGQRFNANITFPSYAESVRLSGSPSSFNHPINLPDSVTNLSNCFRGCTNFNQPINFPISAVNCTYMFAECYNFNQPVSLPSTVEYCASMFQSCYNYNQVTNLPDSVKSTYCMFQSCINFNQPITLGNNIVHTGMMFYSCTRFNSPVTMYSGGNCVAMFNSAYSFNKPVNIPDGVTDVSYMFAYVSMFNSSVVIPETVKNAYGMFYMINSCQYNVDNSRFAPTTNNALQAPIYFYMNNVQTAGYMFHGSNTVSELYLIGLKNNYQTNQMLRNNGSFRLNIYTDDIGQEYLSTSPLMVNSMKPTWTADEPNGCIYNEAMNIYIYNNWDGTI